MKKEVQLDGETVILKAEKLQTCGDSYLIEFTWDHPTCTFADLLDAAGVLPIPPYLNRETEKSDLQTYQTVYSKIKGSVAAPTAGLHFTPEVLAAIDALGIGSRITSVRLLRSARLRSVRLKASIIWVSRWLRIRMPQPMN